MKQEIHLKSPGNWINDPNGFIYFQGRYHMFYQHFPYAPQWGTMHWGHAVSDDLVTWEHLPIALFPSMEEDQNGCFSGSAVEKDGKMYLFYTGVHYDKPNPQNIHVPYGDTFDASQIMISSEDGLTFDNFKGKQVVVPTILDEKLGHRVNTRDPKVWKGKDAFYMVLGTMTEDEGGKLLFYKSADLKKWTLVKHVSKNHEHGFMWECPDYFEAEGGASWFFEIYAVGGTHTKFLTVKFGGADERLGGAKKLNPGEEYTSDGCVYGVTTGDFQDAVKELKKFKEKMLCVIFYFL